MARKKTPGTKPVTLLTIGHCYFAFESVTKASEIVKLLGSSVEVLPEFPEHGPIYYVPLDKSSRQDSQAQLSIQLNIPFRDEPAFLSLPERGTHPALCDPKLA